MTSKSSSFFPFIILLALCGVVVAVVLLSTDESEEQPVELPVTSTEAMKTGPDATSESDVVSAPPSEARDLIEVTDPLPAEGSTFLSGIVLFQEDDGPVSDVEVRCRFDREDVLKNHGAAVKTDKEGRFSFQLKTPAVLSRVHVDAGPVSTGLKKYYDMHIPASTEKVLTLHVSRGSLVQGVVVDQDEQPVPGAEVLGWCKGRSEVDPAFAADPDRVADTDEKGHFMIKHLGEEFVLDARAHGLVCYRRLHGMLPPGKTVSGLKLKLGPACVLRGRVLDPDRTPLEGVQVITWQEWSSGSMYDTDIEGVSESDPTYCRAFTNSDGAFEIPNLAHQSYIVTVKVQGFPEWKRRHKPDHPSIPPKAPPPISPRVPEKIRKEMTQNRIGEGFLEIVLERGTYLQGRIVNGLGKPVDRAEVKLDLIEGDAYYKNQTDEKGVFEFLGLMKDRKWRLLVTAEEYAIHVLEPIPLGPDDPRFIEVVLEESNVLAGTVLNEQGEGVFNAKVSIEGDREVALNAYFGCKTTWEWCLDLNTTYTDQEGRFRFNCLYPGLFLIKAANPDNKELEMEIQAQSGREDLVIRFDANAMRKVVILGAVLDAITGEPVKEFSMSPMRKIPDGSGLEGSSRSFKSPNGRFELPGLEPGEISLSVTAPGYAAWAEDMKHYDLGEHQVEIRMNPARKLHARIVDQSGQPHQGFLQFKDSYGEGIMVSKGLAGSGTNTLHLKDGEAVAFDLPAEQITMMVHLLEETRQWEFEVNLTEESEGVQEFMVNKVPPSEWTTMTILILEADKDTEIGPWLRLDRKEVTEKYRSWIDKELEKGIKLTEAMVIDYYLNEENAYILKAVAVAATVRDEDGRGLSAARSTKSEDGNWAMDTMKGGTTWSQSGSTLPVLSLKVPKNRF
ncbi:MAG: carboxypeptidase-like regulatory domain-containing protein, partial [Planctomycetes bacterium]|nr:carboxypeptidase-like regulatory domain-containing protein [Planctomycetota bacterium]